MRPAQEQECHDQGGRPEVQRLNGTSYGILEQWLCIATICGKELVFKRDNVHSYSKARLSKEHTCLPSRD
jgi:hypothetical protein